MCFTEHHYLPHGQHLGFPLQAPCFPRLASLDRPPGGMVCCQNNMGPLLPHWGRVHHCRGGTFHFICIFQSTPFPQENFRGGLPHGMAGTGTPGGRSFSGTQLTLRWVLTSSQMRGRISHYLTLFPLCWNPRRLGRELALLGGYSPTHHTQGSEGLDI